MNDPDFPPELYSFIQDSIPTVQAAELLLILSGQPERQWKIEEMAHEIRPTAVTAPYIRNYLALFITHGLAARNSKDQFHYSPQSEELDRAVHSLAKVYQERPVTLFRLIYSLKGAKIQSFADAFKIKKD